ncbi:hypothetical protein ACFPN2_32130 [Steroidobacter flavus]|uniref:Uncharacterized protein n=1 Tax=Steroidobacter flavus TaxID=1842136 RepID=A0ABV8T236_9GAMM
MKILTVALTATSIALAGTSAYLWRQLDGERQKVVAAELALAKARTAVPDARPHESMEDASVEPAGPNALATALPGARVAEAGAQESPAESPEARFMRRERTSPYATPQGREMMRLMNKVGNKRAYGDLIKQLGLKDSEVDALLNALADQDEREFETFQQARRSSEGRVDREALETARRDVQTQTQAQIASMLGASTAQKLSDYQATLGERMQVQQLSEQLDAFGLKLTDAQEEQMIAAMSEEKAAFPQPKFNWDDPKARETNLEWREQFNRRVLARSTSILSSEQQRQISEIQTWQTSMQRQGMNRPQRPRGMRPDNPG